MKKGLFILIFLSAFGIAFAQDNIYYAKIEGTIDIGIAPFVERVVEEAAEKNADAILFEINTFGGRVDAATEIKDAILNSNVPTIAFVNKRAISAGALITLSCIHIAMAPGSSIGATTVVDQQGEKQSEKYQSYMRSEMRATAEKNNRRVDVAEGMVDETIVIEGLADSTSLVTLTAEEAINWGMNDFIAKDKFEALEHFGYENVNLISMDTNWAEDIVRFLGNPVISSLLIMMGMVGLFTEVKTAGWGLPGTLGLVALGLFFGSSFILNLASFIDILLFIVGFLLILIEVFVIPGFGIAGISGILLMLAALFLSLFNHEVYFDFDIIKQAILQLALSLVGSSVLIYFIYKYLPKTSAFQTFVLSDSTSRNSGYTSRPSFSDLVGKRGETFTALRPSGTALIEGKRYDVVTEGEFIDKGKLIEVTQVTGLRIVVKSLDS